MLGSQLTSKNLHKIMNSKGNTCTKLQGNAMLKFIIIYFVLFICTVNRDITITQISKNADPEFYPLPGSYFTDAKLRKKI